MPYLKNSYLTVTDQFCGAGGSSIGATLAGAEVKLAMNHWHRALETHNANFPDVMHVRADISSTDPRRFPSTDILITSPECTNHSLAKGVRRRTAQMDAFEEPIADEAAERSRATMWDVPRFAEFHQYNAIIVENVVEAKTWPQYPAWTYAMSLLGYEHKEVFFNSMFAHPTPQSRDRMYVVFWKKGNLAPDLDIRPQAPCRRCSSDVLAVQSWKNPAKPWGKYRQQYLYRCPLCAGVVEPYVWGAWSAIDWSIKGERIGDRARPLAAATMARIQAGINKYWTPGLVDLSYGAQKLASVAEPMFTQTARQSLGLYEPFIAEMHGTGGARSTSDPLMGVTAGGNHHGLTEPPDEALVIRNYTPRGNPSQMVKPSGEPFGTVTAQDHHGLLVKVAGSTFERPGSGYTRTRSTEEVFPTQSGTPELGLVASYYSRDDAVRPADDPMGTVTSEPRHGLVEPPEGLVVPLSMRQSGDRRTRSTEEPFVTVTTVHEQALVVPVNGGRHGDGGHKVRSTDDPFLTQTADLARGLVTPAGGTWRDEAKSTTDPLPARTATDNDGLVEPPESFLTSFYSGSEQNTDTRQPAGTMTALARHALVEKGQWVRIEDCYFRMLQPHEIQKAMAFPGDYKVTGTQREKVRQLGNAVTPPVMSILFSRVAKTFEGEGVA